LTCLRTADRFRRYWFDPHSGQSKVNLFYLFILTGKVDLVVQKLLGSFHGMVIPACRIAHGECGRYNSYCVSLSFVSSSTRLLLTLTSEPECQREITQAVGAIWLGQWPGSQFANDRVTIQAPLNPLHNTAIFHSYPSFHHNGLPTHKGLIPVQYYPCAQSLTQMAIQFS
jgi:hypothetical protein